MMGYNEWELEWEHGAPIEAPDANEEDPREILYKEYATPEQSLEDFCDAMAEQHGVMWVPLLISRR